jgi:hypothetical protein
MPSARRLLMFAAFAAISILAIRLPSSADPTLGVPVTPTGAAGPPVEIDECKLLYSGNWVAGQSAGVQMKFTNDSVLVADVINFHVTATGGESAIIRDVGKFSPGIEMHPYLQK